MTARDNTELPPYDEDAEAGALGCVLQANGNGPELLAKLNLEHFYDERHREMCRALKVLNTEGKSLLMNSVVFHLRAQNRLQDAGGMDYILRLPDKAVSSAEFPTFFDEVDKLRHQRAVVADAAHLESLARDRSVSPEALTHAARTIGQAYSRPSRPCHFSLWRPSQFLSYIEPPGQHVIRPAFLTRGSLTSLIGQAGIGKSRLALWQSICQITGRNWCGLEMHPEPVKWIFLGDENSLARWKTDLERMLSPLSKEEIKSLDEYLLLPALVEPQDGDFWLGDQRTVGRVIDTIAEHKPGVVVFDPLSNVAPEDVSKPGPMKDAVRLIQSIMRQAAPDAACELLHHARPGRQNVLQGVGYDAGTFASGGKALLASCRCQINVMPGSSDDDTQLVMACGKANNCPRFEARGIKFSIEDFSYAVDPSFDLSAWQADVEGKAKSGQSLCTVVEVTGAVADGFTKTGPLVEHLVEACATSKRTVHRILEKAVELQAIKQLSRGNYVLGRKHATYLPKAT